MERGALAEGEVCVLRSPGISASPISDANFPDQNVQRHSVTSLETVRSLAYDPSWSGGGGGGLAEGEVCILRSPVISPSLISIGKKKTVSMSNWKEESSVSFIYGRSLWAELNGGENFLHWKANMLSLFSIMTLCAVYQISIVPRKILSKEDKFQNFLLIVRMSTILCNIDTYFKKMAIILISLSNNNISL